MIFDVAPLDFKPQFEVVGCFLQFEGKFLVLHRDPSKLSGDQWGAPAGKVDPGEALDGVMVREIYEETGIRADRGALRYFRALNVRYPDYDYIYHVFSCDLERAEGVRINSGEHQAFRWVTPEEALTMPLVEDEDACIELAYGKK